MEIISIVLDKFRTKFGYYEKGKFILHNEDDKPAYVAMQERSKNGKIILTKHRECWYKYGLMHRVGKAADITYFKTGPIRSVGFYENGIKHNLYGEQYVRYLVYGTINQKWSSYFIEDKRISKKDFKQAVDHYLAKINNLELFE